MLLAGATLLAAIAAWFLLRDPEAQDGGVVTEIAAPPPVVRTREPMPSEVADPGEARALAERQERRARFEAMRAAFAAAAGEAAVSRARLDPALQALWPGRPAPYLLACRGALCRVEVPAPVRPAQAALAADAGVRVLAEGVFLDPDGIDPVAYVLLAPPNAPPGDDLLAVVEREFFQEGDARDCLSRVGATGSVEYELRIDTSGFTYRSRTDLPRPVLECVDDVLNGIVATTQVPSDVKASTRTFTLRR